MLAVVELARSEVAEKKYVKLRSVDRMWKEIGKANMQQTYPFEDTWADLPMEFRRLSRKMLSYSGNRVGEE